MDSKRPSSAIAVPPDLEDVRRALGGGRPAPPPEVITQAALDHNNFHLLALADPHSEIDDALAAEYATDLRHMPIQRELLSYALPRILPLWRQGLWTHRQPRLPDELHSTLCHAELPLNERERAAVYRYMSGAILERMDTVDALDTGAYNEPLYPLFDYVSMTGVYMPDIGPLWDLWWALGTPGRARVAMQWASILRYDDKENPLWPAWTPSGGGGPPRIWLDSGWVFSVGWRCDNVDYIRKLFTPDWVLARVRAAAQVLAGTPDESLATRVTSEFAEFLEIVTHRLSELPDLLLKPNQPWGGSEFSM